MTQYDIAKANAQLAKLLQEAVSGEEVHLARNGQPPAKLAPIEPVRATRVPGSAKGRIIAVAPDFDDPLADFQAYR